MVNTLTAVEVHKLLDTARVARLGCVANGEPYVVPINYEFRDGAI
jgi:nitroimidazol reductase NimA-like FMN-containing flavoprotein (pyridoxamine 5'-phosphate oxidase superfamily)